MFYHYIKKLHILTWQVWGDVATAFTKCSCNSKDADTLLSVFTEKALAFDWLGMQSYLSAYLLLLCLQPMCTSSLW
jgi:hypothetical protein